MIMKNKLDRKTIMNAVHKLLTVAVGKGEILSFSGEIPSCVIGVRIAGEDDFTFGVMIDHGGGIYYPSRRYTIDFEQDLNTMADEVDLWHVCCWIESPYTFDVEYTSNEEKTLLEEDVLKCNHTLMTPYGPFETHSDVLIDHLTDQLEAFQPAV